MPAPQRVPSLTRHKASGQGVVRLGGRDHYLGSWPGGRRKPPEDVQARYDALVAEWLASGRSDVSVPDLEGPRTVSDLLSAFWAHVERHYRRPDGSPTGEQEEFRLALRPVRHL